MSVVQRVWDTVDAGFVTWTTHAPDPDGVAYPGSGVFGTNTSDYTIVSDQRKPAQADAEPLGLWTPSGTVQALWTLDHTLADATATGNDLSVSGGTVEKYALAPGGRRSFQFIQGSSDTDRLVTSAGAVNDPIRFSGASAMTCEMLLRPSLFTTDPDCSLIRFGDDQAPSSATHMLWSLGLYGTTGGGPNELLYVHTDDTSTFRILDSGVILSPFCWYHIAFTRDSAGTGISLYVNGRLANSGTLAAAPSSDGASSFLTLGNRINGVGNRRYNGGMCSVRIIDAELTAAQILQSSRVALPPGDRP